MEKPGATKQEDGSRGLAVGQSRRSSSGSRAERAVIDGEIVALGERSSDWVKLKFENQHEFVVGGYRPDGATSIDALIVGYYEGKDLRFAGKVRAGFTPRVRREVASKLNLSRSSAARLSIFRPRALLGGAEASRPCRCMKCAGFTLV